jgi:CBS domain-containing protein
MKTIGQLLKIKGNTVWSIEPDAPVFDALKLMAEKNVGALLVMEAGKLIGIISERDYARKVILIGRSSKATPVSDIMSTRVIYARPNQTVDEGLALMSDKHVRHLPVFDDYHLVGIVSIGDLVNAIIVEQQRLIGKLENYILEYTSIT